MENEKMTIFARRVTELRKEKKLTQAQLADMTGVAKTSLCFYEQAERIPDIQTLVQFAKALDVTSDYLIGLSENRNREYPLEAPENVPKRNYEFSIRTGQNGEIIVKADTITDLQELFKQWNTMVCIIGGHKNN